MDLKSTAYRMLEDRKGKEAEAKKDAAQARTELKSANEVIAEKGAQIEVLQNMLKDHEDAMHRSSTQGAATVPGPEVELLTEASEYTQAHDTVTRWKEWFQFVEDEQFVWLLMSQEFINGMISLKEISNLNLGEPLPYYHLQIRYLL